MNDIEVVVRTYRRKEFAALLWALRKSWREGKSKREGNGSFVDLRLYVEIGKREYFSTVASLENTF